MTEIDAVDFDLDVTGYPLFTIATTSVGEGRDVRRKPGSRAYGHMRVAIAPHRGHLRYRFEWSVPDGILPLPYMRTASLDGVKAALREPLRGGGHVAFLCVSVLDGSYHETDTNEAAVSIAARMAVKDALSRARLVEP